MENRDRILAAAARVYAEFGFRGATTRRIATAAGVNEVTLFRTFGSKAALLDAALRSRAAAGVVGPHALPAVPADPEGELSAWAAAHLAELRASRAIIRKAFGETEAHPDIGPCVAHGWNSAGEELRRYMVAMGKHGFVDWATFNAPEGGRPCARPRPRAGVDGTARPKRARNEYAFAAGTMLMAALFSDAVGRDVMPELYPQPAGRAPALYVRLFLQVVGCRAPAAPESGKGSISAPAKAPAAKAAAGRAAAARRAAARGGRPTPRGATPSSTRTTP